MIKYLNTNILYFVTLICSLHLYFKSTAHSQEVGVDRLDILEDTNIVMVIR